MKQELAALDTRLTQQMQQMNLDLEKRLTQQMQQMNLDLEVRLDTRFLAFEERMEKLYVAGEDRIMKALAGYVQAIDRRFARNESVISRLTNPEGEQPRS